MSAQQNIPPKWDWIPCNYNLKTEVKKKVVVWNLQPAIVLTNPNEEGPDPHVKLYIDTEKSLQYTDELGWNWHKSWNLPNISVRLEIKDAQTNESLLSPKNLYAHIFAVKAVIDQPDNFHLVDVGIRGTSKLELVNGQAFFQAIKFFSTSYNNEGVKFHLVLCIYIMNEDDDVPKILNATISPPIFVDSRKSARDSQIMLEKKMSSFVEPFLPENLDRAFIKRENKKKNDTEIKIFNTLDGLFNYLTAPNIRHKVKHPLFLALKFSYCVKLFYNNQILQQNKNEQLLEQLQKKLTKEHCSNKPLNSTGSTLDDKFFILYVEESPDNFKHKKINEAIESLACPSLGIIFSLNRLPPIFDDITGGTQEGVNEMISTYRKCYSNLLAAAKMIRSSEVDDDGEEGESLSEDEEQESYSEDEGPSSQPVKKIKPNPPARESKYNKKQANNDSEEESDEENAYQEKPAPKTNKPQQFSTKVENVKDMNGTEDNNWNTNSNIQTAAQQSQVINNPQKIANSQAGMVQPQTQVAQVQQQGQQMGQSVIQGGEVSQTPQGQFASGQPGQSAMNQQQMMKGGMVQNPQMGFNGQPGTPQAGMPQQQQMMMPNMVFPGPNMAMNPGMGSMIMMPMGGFPMGGMPGMVMQQQFPPQMQFGQPFVMQGQNPQEVSQMMMGNPMGYPAMWGNPQGQQPGANPQGAPFNTMMMGMSQGPQGNPQ
ncbi:hypothetical protein ABPG74_009580 [Tetrahymena malaccensis]